MQAMQFKDFVFPTNPASCALRFERFAVENKAPMGASAVVDLGRCCCVMEGEGAFFGQDAYENFRRLADTFRSEGAGTLIHPLWGEMQAVFTALSLCQEPEEDYVSYRFTFRETSALDPMEEVDQIVEVM